MNPQTLKKISAEDATGDTKAGCNWAEVTWNTEIEKRVNEIKSGKAKGRAAEDILAEIRAKFS